MDKLSSLVPRKSVSNKNLTYRSSHRGHRFHFWLKLTRTKYLQRYGRSCWTDPCKLLSATWSFPPHCWVTGVPVTGVPKVNLQDPMKLRSSRPTCWFRKTSCSYRVVPLPHLPGLKNKETFSTLQILLVNRGRKADKPCAGAKLPLDGTFNIWKVAQGKLEDVFGGGSYRSRAQLIVPEFAVPTKVGGLRFIRQK